MNNELAVVEDIQQHTPSIFQNTEPALIIEEATEIANQLSDIIKTKKLYKQIGNKAHVFVEGWTTLGALLGVFPYPETSIRLDREDEIAYEASVIVRTLAGVEVSKGEAICSSKETNWKSADEYAIKSMATTRATSKALRIPLGWIMILAGYSATPAEEMMGRGFSQPSRTQKPAPTAKVRRAPKSSNNGKRPKSTTKPKDPEWDATMPDSEPVKEPENVQEAQLTGESYWKQLGEQNVTLHTTITEMTKRKIEINKKNILETSLDLIPEWFDNESRQDLLAFLKDKHDQ